MRNSENSLKWIIGTLIALIAAGSGFVALINYFNPPHQTISPPPANVITGVTPTSPPDACIQGYVWREAGPNDHVCVTPDVRAQVITDNSQADQRHITESDVCINGYVWREAFTNDHVCVTPQTRSQAQYDNSQAQNRIAQ